MEGKSPTLENVVPISGADPMLMHHHATVHSKNPKPYGHMNKATQPL